MQELPFIIAPAPIEHLFDDVRFDLGGIVWNDGYDTISCRQYLVGGGVPSAALAGRGRRGESSKALGQSYDLSGRGLLGPPPRIIHRDGKRRDLRA